MTDRRGPPQQDGAGATAGGDHASEQRWSVRLAYALARVHGDFALLLLDVLLAGGVYLAVLVLRFNGAVPGGYWRRFEVFLPLAVGVHVLMNWVWGLYGQMWRHASVQEARRLLLAGGCSGIVLLGIAYLPGFHVAPGSVVVLGACLTSVLSGAPRFQSRLLAFQRAGGREFSQRVLVIGAGDAGALILRDMLADRDAGMHPVAVLDDDRYKQGRRLHGVAVEGRIDDMARVARAYRVDQVLLAISSADGSLISRVSAAADDLGLPLKVLPRVGELLRSEPTVRDLRGVNIDDLLGRKQISTDLDAVRQVIAGRTVLITGAGGSIGSELARQVAGCEPATLVLLDHDETHLHDAAALLPGDVEQVLVDIRDARMVDETFARFLPDIVFHAAAHKHVYLMEQFPSEAVRTNVFGTDNVLRAAAAAGVERTVFISTDKAVRPSSVMGASKWCGEQLLLSREPPSARWCAVRFGNVLGSRGSAVTAFARQIAAGQPVTVTDARMERFFMSVSEAVQLVLQAAAFAQGSDIFMLDMGEPVNIMKLAERMIRMSGRMPGTDVPIRIVGARPGEKLSEELCSPAEARTETSHPSISRLEPLRLPSQLLAVALERLEGLVDRRDDSGIASFLHELSSDDTLDPVINLRERVDLVDRHGPAEVSRS